MTDGVAEGRVASSATPHVVSEAELVEGRQMWRPRLGRDAVAAVAVVAVGVVLTGCTSEGRTGAGEDEGRAEVGAGAAPAATVGSVPPGPPTSPGSSAPGPVLDRAVIVSLAVSRRPESELAEDEVRAQRERVRQAEGEVLRALGPHGRLRRQLHETAQTALLVDAEGLAVLRAHPRVRAVQQDRAVPAATG